MGAAGETTVGGAGTLATGATGAGALGSPDASPGPSVAFGAFGAASPLSVAGSLDFSRAAEADGAFGAGSSAVVCARARLGNARHPVPRTTRAIRRFP